MSKLAAISPVRRHDLLVRPLGSDGQHVVKDPRTGYFYQLGEHESFLLARLDGKQTAETIRHAFAERFGQSLSKEDFQEFLELARCRGFLQVADANRSDGGCRLQTTEFRPPKVETCDPKPIRRPRQSLLYWRKSLFDPDRLFNWLEPKLRLLWTRGFFGISVGCILAATVLLWANRQELMSSFAHALCWQTLVPVWLTLLAVTTLHEFAHGLTLKHHGGDVHEVGFLMLFLMPCLYCNVSDAWLLPEKSKRLWVTFAGGYFELFLWSLTVFVWRLTVPGSLIYHIAFVVVSLCGVQTLFNFNPLLKLDGYYLLSDWLEIPNLQQRASQYFKSQLRRLLWGAPCPATEPRSKTLLGYAILSLAYSLSFLTLMLVAIVRMWGTRWGLVGVAVAASLGVFSLRGLFQGFLSGEVRTMVLTRHKRALVWGMIFTAVPVVLTSVEIEDRSSGSCQIRAVSRAEVHAPAAGFLREVYFEQGDRVSPGEPVARLEVPDLASRIVQKRAEVCEAEATLRLLEAGPRPQELAEQRERVHRAKEWRDLAQQDLARSRQATEAELVQLDQQVVQHRVELDFAQSVQSRAERLISRRAMSDEEFQAATKKSRLGEAQLAQAEAQRRARQTLGTQEAEAELARRERELADAQAALALLEAGTRPEQIDAGRARLARLQEELTFLETTQEKLLVYSSVGGSVTTPHLKEKVGQFLREGELICEVQDNSILEAEITLAEQEVARVRSGQTVTVRTRAQPFQTLVATVDRIAPLASPGEDQGTVTVSCRLADSASDLRPGATGYARIETGRRPIGKIVVERALRFLRTEFWW